jgi:hypothetical protein
MKSSIGIRKERQKEDGESVQLHLFNKVNLMWRKFRAELWSYDPNVDPPSLQHYNQFGQCIFVIRNESSYGPKRETDRAWFQAHKETLSIDPGLKVFQTVYNVGTGDVFMIGHGLGEQLKTLAHRISDYQSKIDTVINENEDLVKLKSAWDDAKLCRFKEVFLFD